MKKIRLKELFRKLIHSATPYSVVAHQERGYKVVINKSVVYRHEHRWKDANRITRALQRKGVNTEMVRIHPKAA